MLKLKEIFSLASNSRHTAVKLGSIQWRSTVTLSIIESEPTPTVVTADGEYLSGLKLYILLSGLSLVVLLIALDNAILSTAIPTITAYFHSIDDVGWYGSVYLLTTCVLQPLSGKIYSQYSLKYIFLAFLATFELGSLVCATATTSKTLILGRAIAGMRSSGLFSRTITIMAATVQLEKRALYMGIVSSIFGVTTIARPLIGVALSDHVSWRWCFYINLPAGAVTALLLMLFFRPRERKLASATHFQNIQKLDLIGCSLFMPACTMLLLALQWGGSRYLWNSAVVIGLFCGCVPLLGIFIGWQHHKGSEAMIPLGILSQRTVLSSCMGGALLYLPIWFQAVKGASPTMSDVMNLPMILAQVIVSVVAGLLVTKIGYVNPWIVGGAAITAVGSGLMTTFIVNESAGKWIRYQIITGSGRGMLMQMPLIAVQTVLPPIQIAIGTALVVFCQYFGGAVFIALGQTAFINRLVSSLQAYAPDSDLNSPAELMIIDAGATATIRSLVPKSSVDGVLTAYISALTVTFYVAVGASCTAFIADLGMEWKSVKAKAPTVDES
ncbi:major facilitator superfamily domain-containing protein [Trichophaea hybrida]|nr:major facilitator superfamily domain-containing protein [Trichophaea hybrida]